MRVVDFINQADPDEVAAEYRRVWAREAGVHGEDGWAHPGAFRKFRGIVNDTIGEVVPMRVVITMREEDGEEYPDVSGADDSAPNWAIEFEPWGKWKLCEVERPHNLTVSQVACHLYYEMTWAGWPEQIVAKLDELRDRTEQVDRDMARVEKGETTLDKLGYVEFKPGEGPFEKEGK